MQIAPLESNWAAIMYNLYNESNRRTAIDTVLATRDACSTDLIALVQDQAINATRASGLMLAPIFGGVPDWPSGERPITGIASLVYSWDNILNDSIPSTSVDVDVVISGPRQIFSLRISKGNVRNIGPGDRHEISGRQAEQYMRVIYAEGGPIFTIRVRRHPSGSHPSFDPPSSLLLPFVPLFSPVARLLISPHLTSPYPTLPYSTPP